MSALSKPEERLFLLVWLGIFAGLLCLIAKVPPAAQRGILVADTAIAWLWLRKADRRERFWRWLLSTVLWPGFACRVFGHRGSSWSNSKWGLFTCDLCDYEREWGPEE